MASVVFVRLAFLWMLLAASNSSNPWMLYANINPCDGGNMGYGASAWYGSAGSAATSLTNDFVDGTVGTAPVKYVTIARHAGGACEMSKTWELTSSTKSMYDYFSDHNPGRIYATGDGSASDTHIASDMPSSFSGDGTPGDPIFGADGGLVFNWWYSNNGARVAVPGGYKTPYSLPGTGTNNDDLHGLGNEFGAGTQAGGGSGTWWHDAAKIQGDCHGTSCQVLGSDHGSAWGSTNFGCWGSYAIYVSAALSTFPCQGSTLSAQVSGAAAGGAEGEQLRRKFQARHGELHHARGTTHVAPRSLPRPMGVQECPRLASWRYIVEGAGMSSTQESSCRQTETGWSGRKSRGGGKLRCSNGRG
ncbi:unnamed protein product [Prorocentrum cordatum]|uniref:Subtilisin n=1 Tax=Prorocentrum cordatum TaxID=2364126 RepID=A0ABN9XG12_9DINO|nr:unnamed protein product [Polarella glacialis]